MAARLSSAQQHSARSDTFPAAYRAFAAYWITMLFAAWFIFGSILCLQGLAAQLLPRRYFLRVSSLLQIAVFCVLIASYFLLPPLATPASLSAVRNQVLLAGSPTYWFLDCSNN